MKIIAFLLSVGPLIILHELGHYFAARACGVKVVRFSIFMGKIIWSRKFGRDQTEWAISAIPIGGYVKMLDDRDPATRATTPEDQKREFTRQNVWKRIAIIGAGPLTNFIVAIFLLAGLFMHGVPEPGNKVRIVPVESVAYQAGLRGGEAIVAVDGEPVEAWGEIHMAFVRAAMDKQEVRLDLRQEGGGNIAAVIPASAMSASKLDGDVLGSLGLMVQRQAATIGMVFPDGAAARAGLQSGDVVLAVDGKPMIDGITTIDAIRASQGQPLAVLVQRGAEQITLQITPQIEQSDKIARIKAEVLSPAVTVMVVRGPVDAVAKGASATWEQSVLIVKMIGKMFTGEVSVKNLTGPITIADVADQTIRHGLVETLKLIAAISIGLGVMNLLPIPVLDGGLLLYYSLEVLTGRPLPPKVDQHVRTVGFVLFVMLMSLALYNDVTRLIS
ncbi:RIP metalloprotease RseP [Massilia sp. CF038]|uniref:RIP metalloprotease RseP n=1 Tax=Massilia sp. CF038 TaxID=1881045 RepID=UPI001E490F3C|nr:RIP metalloprotease RseP [Massilia sp. CF038]